VKGVWKRGVNRFVERAEKSDRTLKERRRLLDETKTSGAMSWRKKVYGE